MFILVNILYNFKISCIKVIKFYYHDRWTVKHKIFLPIGTVDAKFEEAAKQLLCRFPKFGNMFTTLLAPLYTFIHLCIEVVV